MTIDNFSIATITDDDYTGFPGAEFCASTLKAGQSGTIIVSFTADSQVNMTHAARRAARRVEGKPVRNGRLGAADTNRGLPEASHSLASGNPAFRGRRGAIGKEKERRGTRKIAEIAIQRRIERSNILAIKHSARSNLPDARTRRHRIDLRQ